MKQTYKNKLLAEYSREDLEDEFLKNCEALDNKATVIIQLEQKAQYLSSRLSRLTQDLKDPAKVQERFLGSQAPSAYKASQVQAKALTNQIAAMEREIGQRKLKRDAIVRHVRYFKSLQNMPSQKPRSVRSRVNPLKASLTKEDVQGAIIDLMDRKVVPQMANRLQAALAILQGNYKAAEPPLSTLMKSIGENVGFYECLERRKQLREREAKIVQLTARLEELKQRYEEMVAHQKEQVGQYQMEAEQNKQRNREIQELQAEKERKEKDTAKTAELRIIAEGLRSEIEVLMSQKEKLQGDNDERQMRVQTQVQDALLKLRAEIKELEDKCAKVRSENEVLEKQLQELEDENAKVTKERTETEDEFRKLQDEYKKVLGTFGRMMELADADPFEDQRFVQFLTQMADKDWTPDNVKDLGSEIEELTERLEKLKEKISKYEATETSLNQNISTKRGEIANLEAELRALADDLGQNSGEGREKPEYTEGAKHIRWSREQKSKIGEDQTAVCVLFREFKMSPSFIGKTPSQIFLVIDFLEHQSMSTDRVDPNDDMFNSSLFFVCKNDFILRAYLEKSAVPVQLCRARDDQITEAGKTELNLMPFLEGVKSFTSEAQIWNTGGRLVGKVTFEAALYKPLLKE